MNKGSWLSAAPSAKTAGCIHFCLLEMDLSTFSTGFSTEIVKKSPVFPRCFPLFPLSFPLFQSTRFIHGVFQETFRSALWGEKRAFLLFSERKSNPKIYFLQQRPETVFRVLRAGMQFVPVFNIVFHAKPLCGKPPETPGFPQKMPPQLPAQNRLRRHLHPRKKGVTSCCGTPAVRSGNTGSGCMHPRWW